MTEEIVLNYELNINELTVVSAISNIGFVIRNRLIILSV